MNSLLDPFLYELVRAHEQELREAARVSRVLGTGEPPGLRRVIQGLGRRIWRRTHASGRRRGGTDGQVADGGHRLGDRRANPGHRGLLPHLMANGQRVLETGL